MGSLGAHRTGWKTKTREWGLEICWEPWQRRAQLRSWQQYFGSECSSMVIIILGTGWQLSPLAFSLVTSSQSRMLVQPSHIPCTRCHSVEMYISLRTQCNSVPDLGLLISTDADRESIESLYCTLFRELAIWEGFELTFLSLHLHPPSPASRLYNKGEKSPKHSGV